MHARALARGRPAICRARPCEDRQWSGVGHDELGQPSQAKLGALRPDRARLLEGAEHLLEEEGVPFRRAGKQRPERLRELGHPDRAAFEAQRAQAIAARTYALKRLGTRADLGFDVYGSVLDQAYGGIPDPADSLAVKAVRSTRGLALLYGGHLIDAYYHSTCGGSTARVELVFDDPPAPYLVPVSDRRPDGSYWCQGSRYFRWTTTFEGPEVQAMMERNLPALVPLPPEGVGRVQDVELERTTPEGRALSVRVIASSGRYLVSENAIRSLFADAEGGLLQSTQFLLRPVHRGGVLQRLVLVGGGWGHGVGMCQWGAIARARAGDDLRAILKAYYPGAELTRAP